MSIVDTFGREYQKAKAELQGVARSRARRWLNLRDIKELAHLATRLGSPRAVSPEFKDLGGNAYVYFSDGSVRHAQRHVRNTRQVRRLRRSVSAVLQS